MNFSLNKEKINILMLSTRWDDNKCGIGLYSKYLSEEERMQGLNVHNLYLNPNTVNPFNYIEIAIAICRKKRQIIHVQFDYSFFGKIGPLTGVYIIFFYPLMRLLSLYYRPIIFTTMHEVWDRYRPPKFGKLGSLYCILLNWTIGTFSTSIIVLSETAKNRLLDQFISKNKIHVIGHGVFNPVLLDKKMTKRRLSIDPEQFVITIFGYIKPSKGHDLLIKASRYLSRNIIFLIAGDIQSEHDRPFLETLKRQSPENIRYLGFVNEDEIPLVLNSTDVLVLPYREITQSGVLNWSLAYQIPTITSNLPYFKEIQSKCSCILLFENNDVSSLVTSIEKIYQDVNQRKILQNAGKKYYDTNSFSQNVSEIIRLYSSYIKRFQ